MHKSHCNPTVRSLLKFGLSILRVRYIGGGEVTLSNSGKNLKIIYGEGQKTHSMFPCDQTNASWFRIRAINLGSPDGRGRAKSPMGKDEKKTHSKFHQD